MVTGVIVVLGAAFILMLAWTFLIKLEQFREEMDYINTELARSGTTRAFWKKQKRRLWLWLLFSIPRD